MGVERDPSRLSGHVVVCNVNDKVCAIVDQLRNDPLAGVVDVVLIVQDAKLWSSNPSWHPSESGDGAVLTVFGCPAENDVLRRASISRARAAIILADPAHGALADARSALIGISIERENPQVHTVMELLLSVNRSHLRATAVDEVVCVGELSEKLLSQSVVNPGVSKLFAHLLTSKPGTGQLVTRPVPSDLCGLSYREIARRAIRRGVPFVVCGFVREGGHAKGRVIVVNPRVNTDPGKDSILVSGDELILLCCCNPDVASLR